MKEQWQISWRDYYKIIQVQPSAEPEVIKAAYSRLARKYHPDINPDPSAVERMKALNEAYETLSDPARQARYDQEYARRGADDNQAASPPPRTPPPPPASPPRTSRPRARAARPRLVIAPPVLRFDKVEPGHTYTSAFTIDNGGKPFSKLEFTRPNSWLKVVRWSSQASSGLPLRVEVQGTGAAWNKAYTELITVQLDQEEARVKIELNTRPRPGPSFMHYGQEVTGAIAKHGERAPDFQDWKFSGTAGNRVSIRLSRGNDVFFYPSLMLRDPAGNMEAEGDGWGNRGPVLSHALKSSGEYTLHVFGHNGSAGSYRLALEARSPPAYIQPGREVSGEIGASTDKGGDYQDWLFAGEAGERVSIRLSRSVAVTSYPAMELRGPGDVREAEGDGWGNRGPISGHALKASGVYTIRVFGQKGATGGYRLSLERA